MKEIRTAEIRATAPTAEGATSLVIEGVAIVFDTPTVITDRNGSYTEIIKRGALDNAELTDSRLLYNHDLTRVPLAKTPKTMSFNITNVGLEFRAELPNTEQAREVYEAVKRGDLAGCSFGFTVPENGQSYDPKTNTRTITKIDKVYEVSITPFPAYPTTSVEARSLQLASLERFRALQNAKILCNKILRKEV
jgi:HK97 family phage prohead protease